MLEVRNLTKKFGDFTAVDDITFTVQPGIVTGFLGPNGAGKTTTMKMILGLDKPTAGTILVNGHSYRDSRAPMHELGALLDAKAVDKSRTARNHLISLAATLGIKKDRVDTVIESVGLTDVARKNADAFSLGMGQRLGIATALLADPQIIMLDEPVNGLDPDGILWIRGMLQDLAKDGKTVFVSSHLMSEMEMTAEHLIVVGQGRILSNKSMAEFMKAATDRTTVKTPEPDRLTNLVLAANLRTATHITVTTNPDGSLLVDGVNAETIGDLAAQNSIALHKLIPIEPSLEEAFMNITADTVLYHGRGTGEKAS